MRTVESQIQAKLDCVQKALRALKPRLMKFQAEKLQFLLEADNSTAEDHHH